MGMLKEAATPEPSSDESKLSKCTTERPSLDSRVSLDDFLAQGGGMEASRQAEGMDMEASNPRETRHVI